jgi:hypothetical protein
MRDSVRDADHMALRGKARPSPRGFEVLVDLWTSAGGATLVRSSDTGRGSTYAGAADV